MLRESSYGRIWQRARAAALTEAQAASPLASRPDDLRHGGITLSLNAGVPAPEVARRSGHGMAVLLRVYAGCVDGHEQLWNNRIDEAVRGCWEADAELTLPGGTSAAVTSPVSDRWDNEDEVIGHV